MIKSENITKQLKKRGYKITRQREGILDVFIGSSKYLMTAHEIFEEVNKINTGTNYSTVYRNLEMLVKESIVNRIILDNDAAYYELNINDGHHHHLICKGCGDVKKTSYCPFSSMPDDEEFVPTDHKFEVYGFCKECFHKS